MSRSQIDWDAYLGEFHARRPGITEDVLAGSRSGAMTPYQWLVDGIGPTVCVLDLGCGSGPARPASATRWVGVDRSERELQRAAEAGRGPLVLGDATRLPAADVGTDVVTSSMALMLVQPLGAALEEVHRILRPGGELRLLLPTPTPRPITMRDAATYLRLFWAARSTTRFPSTELRSAATEVLGAHDLDVTSDEHRRFELPIQTAAEAERFVGSWYLPTTSAERLAAAQRRAAAMAPFSIGIPLRRIVARRA